MHACMIIFMCIGVYFVTPYVSVYEMCACVYGCECVRMFMRVCVLCVRAQAGQCMFIRACLPFIINITQK